jgi:hypothetical protein
MGNSSRHRITLAPPPKTNAPTHFSIKPCFKIFKQILIEKFQLNPAEKISIELRFENFNRPHDFA